jgi:signal recognition particle receptor subunit beta
VLLDPATREISLKVVYYGSTGSGKATNLAALHSALRPEARGRMMTIATGDDRTLAFDVLVAGVGGMVPLRVKVFSVPTEEIHVSTRRLLLDGADGVAFVADSRTSATESNAAAFLELSENLHANGTDIAEMPLVIQFNKRDLPEVRSDGELAQIARRGREPVFLASAATGEGVRETFLGLLGVVSRRLGARDEGGARLDVDAVLEAAGRAFTDALPREALVQVSVGGHFGPAGPPPP